MQTNGTHLLTVELCILACVLLAAQEGRNVPRLWYLGAVREGGQERDICKRPPRLKGATWTSIGVILKRPGGSSFAALMPISTKCSNE